VQDFIIIVLLTILVLDFIKSITIGSNFNFIKYFKYKDDYMKWYTIRQKYIPAHKRTHFKKKQ